MQNVPIVQLFMVVVLCINNQLCLAQSYSLTYHEDTYSTLQNAIPLNETVWEDEPLIASIGFDFEIMEETFKEISIQNGQIYFDQDIFLSPLGGTDLEGKGEKSTESPIQYLLEGEIGQRIFKLEFKNAGFYSGVRSDFIHFQVWLYEGSNQIEFRYGQHRIKESTMIYEAIKGPSIGIGKWASDRQTFSFYGLKGQANQPITSSVKNIYTTYHCPFISGTPLPNAVYKLTNDSENLAANKKLAVTFLKTYPNPFSITLNVEFELTQISNFKLEFLDAKGQLIKEIAAKNNALPDRYSFQINGSNLTAGIYICRLITGNKVLSKKVFYLNKT